jgi:hypothetical protein
VADQPVYFTYHSFEPVDFYNVPQLWKLHEQPVIVHLLAEGANEHWVPLGLEGFQYYSAAHGLRNNHPEEQGRGHGARDKQQRIRQIN